MRKAKGKGVDAGNGGSGWMSGLPAPLRAVVASGLLGLVAFVVWILGNVVMAQLSASATAKQVDEVKTLIERRADEVKVEVKSLAPPLRQICVNLSMQVKNIEARAAALAECSK